MTARQVGAPPPASPATGNRSSRGSGSGRRRGRRPWGRPAVARPARRARNGPRSSSRAGRPARRGPSAPSRAAGRSASGRWSVTASASGRPPPPIGTGGRCGPRPASAQVIARSPALAPSQRSGSGSHRGERWPTHGRRVRAVSRAEDQVGQRPAGQVGGRHAVTDVTAGPGQPGGEVQADRGVPVPGDAQRTAPAMGDRDVAQDREQLDQGRSSASNTAGDRSKSGRTREPRWYGAPRPPKTIRPSALRWP